MALERDPFLSHGFDGELGTIGGGPPMFFFLIAKVAFPLR